MKLNEFKKLDERWGWNTDGVNQMGNAQLTSLKNKIVGNADADLDPKELRAKQIFINDFVTKASAGLENAIKTGALTAQPAQGQPAVAQQPAQAQPGQPAVAQQPAQGQAQPGQQSPEQIRKAKQAAAGQAAQAQMTNAPAKPGQPAVAQQPAQPGQPSKMTPQQTAALKGRLKAGASATSAQSGFKNYVGGSGERLTGADKTGAPIFKKIQRENRYAKLNAIFESILNEDAGGISNFVLSAFKEFAAGPGLSDPALMKQAQQLANEVEATYTKDKGVAALRKLGDVGYRVATAPDTQQPSAQGQAQPNVAAQPAAGQQQPPAQGGPNAKQIYQEISKLLDPLDTASQQKLVNGLEKYVQMQSV